MSSVKRATIANVADSMSFVIVAWCCVQSEPILCLVERLSSHRTSPQCLVPKAAYIHPSIYISSSDGLVVSAIGCRSDIRKRHTFRHIQCHSMRPRTENMNGTSFVTPTGCSIALLNHRSRRNPLILHVWPIELVQLSWVVRSVGRSVGNESIPIATRISSPVANKLDRWAATNRLRQSQKAAIISDGPLDSRAVCSRWLFGLVLQFVRPQNDARNTKFTRFREPNFRLNLFWRLQYNTAIISEPSRTEPNQAPGCCFRVLAVRLTQFDLVSPFQLTCVCVFMHSLRHYGFVHFRPRSTTTTITTTAQRMIIVIIVVIIITIKMISNFDYSFCGLDGFIKNWLQLGRWNCARARAI